MARAGVVGYGFRMSIRGFIRAFLTAQPKGGTTDATPVHERRQGEMTLRDAFGPMASDQIAYGSEQHEEIVDHAPSSFFERRERKWRDRMDDRNQGSP